MCFRVNFLQKMSESKFSYQKALYNYFQWPKACIQEKSIFKTKSIFLEKNYKNSCELKDYNEKSVKAHWKMHDFPLVHPVQIVFDVRSKFWGI